MERQNYMRGEEGEKEMRSEPGLKKLTDIGCASYLVAIGYKTKRIERNRYKSIFVFESSPELQGEVSKYFNREARGEPVQFSETLRSLKSATRQG